jgi:nicotinate-nucleotide adenylyltransferase
LTIPRSFQPLPGPAAGLRIGLLGGSFNPAHSGHAHIAKVALQRLQLDWVWWLVARGNPHKTAHGDFATRFASAKACARHPRMIVSAFEADAGYTYTRDTLAALQARAPTTHFVWLMGADNLRGFHRWTGWHDIAARVPIAVIARPGYGLKARTAPFARCYARARLAEPQARQLATLAAPAWTYLKAPFNVQSSTLLRQQSAS